MKLFFRYLLPVTYFQATRLNRWDLVAYNGLVEWVPAVALSLYFTSFTLKTAGVVFLSYLAFICVYEIGYITNDAFSELFEEDPRGRGEQFGTKKWIVWGLVGIRAVFWFLISYMVGGLGDVLWLTFHASLLTTFILHNSMRNEYRTATFFGLSTYRYFAPMILTVNPATLAILFPAVLLNNSLYRTTVYLRNKANKTLQPSPSVRFKMAFYTACLPLSALLTVFFWSPLPLLLCVYFMFVWALYWSITKMAGLRSH